MTESYYMVVQEANEELSLGVFPNKEGLQTGIKNLLALAPAGVKVLIFRGERLMVSRPPYPYLHEAGQEPVPLFETPSPGELAHDGILVQPRVRTPSKDYTELTEKALAEDSALLAEEVLLEDNDEEGP